MKEITAAVQDLIMPPTKVMKNPLNNNSSANGAAIIA
jgi:hypothetical protein